MTTLTFYSPINNLLSKSPNPARCRNAGLVVVLVLVRYAGLVPGPGPAHGHLVARHTLETWIKHTGNPMLMVYKVDVVR